MNDKNIYLNDLTIKEFMDIVEKKDSYSLSDVINISTKAYRLGNEKQLKEFYTLEQLSKELNFNVRALRDFIKNGKLKAHKVGTRYICTREDISDWINNQE